ncbi:hypothetical protein RI367_002279 [Sorochytrium milnesiophthora]
MKIVRVQSSDEFESKLQELASTEGIKKVFVLLFGSEKNDTNESWCPDCVILDPKIRKALLKQPDHNTIALAEVPVGDRDKWRNKDNFYRTHPKLKLEAVPTLVRWDGDSNTVLERQLAESDCADEAKLESFITKP